MLIAYHDLYISHVFWVNSVVIKCGDISTSFLKKEFPVTITLSEIKKLGLKT